MPFTRAIPVVNRAVRGLCTRPYPNHRKGCPNYDKKEGCPPGAPLFDATCKPEVIVVWNVFDFSAHVARMREAHPDWSQRQVECCLYWQGTARKHLRHEVKLALREHPGATVVMCPEAMGVDVTATMRSLGVDLEWPPERKAVQVAFLVEEIDPVCFQLETTEEESP